MAPTAETEGATALVDALAPGDPDRDAVETALARNEFFLAVYESMGVDRETLCELALAPESPRDRDLLDQLRAGFAEAARSPGAIRERLDRLAAADTGRIGARVSRYLPAEATLDRTVYATIDGFNGGVQFRGDVGISVVGRTTGDLDAVLAHELHHAGLFGVLEDRAVGELLDAEGPEADAVEVLVALQAEGYAITYAQGGLDAVGDEAMTVAVEQFREREQVAFETVEAALRAALAGDDDRKTALRAALVDEEGAYAPVHCVGARMVELADRVHGVEALVAAATAPAEFLELYQTAATREGGYRFDPAVIDRVAATVS